MAKKPPKAKPKPLNVRVASDPALLKRALADPGLRSKLADRFLSPAQRQQRATTARLNAPAVPGSSLTNRDVARQANNASTVRYAGAEGQLGQQLTDARQNLTNQGSYYDQYKADLAQHQANVAGYQQGAVDAISHLAPALAGIAPQGQGAQGTVDQQALAVRQALANNFAANAATGQAANNTYADTLTNVVAPAAKLGALSRAQSSIDAVRGKQGDLAREKGAFNQSTRDQIVSDEGKNVLARQTLGLNAQKAAFDQATTTARIQETTRHDKAAEANTAAGQQQQQANQDGSVNKYGYTNAQWKTMTVQQRQKVIKDFKAKGGKTGANSGGPEWLTNEQMGAGLTQLVKLKGFAQKAKTGQPFVPGHKPQGAMSRQQAAQKIYASAPSLKDPVLLSAALDAVYDGHISSATVKRLIDAGYKPSRVAQALGVPTAGKYKPTPSAPLANTGSRLFGGAK